VLASRKKSESTRCSCCLSHTPIALLLCLAACCRTPLHITHHCTPYTILHRTPLHITRHCTPHTIAHHTPLHPAHHCTPHDRSAAAVAPAHHTPSCPHLYRRSSDISPSAGVMRIYRRYRASRGDQCASGALRSSAGGQLLTNWWEVGYITRMCPFGLCSRHMQQISGQY
jgi:hypothetical protein